MRQINKSTDIQEAKAPSVACLSAFCCNTCTQRSWGPTRSSRKMQVTAGLSPTFPALTDWGQALVRWQLLFMFFQKKKKKEGEKAYHIYRGTPNLHIYIPEKPHYIRVATKGNGPLAAHSLQTQKSMSLRAHRHALHHLTIILNT